MWVCLGFVRVCLCLLGVGGGQDVSKLCKTLTQKIKNSRSCHKLISLNMYLTGLKTVPHCKSSCLWKRGCAFLISHGRCPMDPVSTSSQRNRRLPIEKCYCQIITEHF